MERYSLRIITQPTTVNQAIGIVSDIAEALPMEITLMEKEGLKRLPYPVRYSDMDRAMINAMVIYYEIEISDIESLETSLQEHSDVIGRWQIREIEPIKYFEVEREFVKGNRYKGVVLSDGITEEEERDKEVELTLALVVNDYGEDGQSLQTKRYPVEIKDLDLRDNSEGRCVWGNWHEMDKVLDQIKADYPPNKYQNHYW